MSPVTIPALTTIVDRQFKEDRTLCLVRAFRYSKAFYGGPNHASVSLESSQLIYKFLPKRPYLVRQRQQYVSGTSSSGTTTTPRPVPSDYSSSERKEGGWAHQLQPSLQESLPGSRYLVTSSGCYGKVFYVSFLYLTG